MNQPAADMLRALDQFVGEWTMTAEPPGGPLWPGQSTIQFAWMEGGGFLVQRWRIESSDPLPGDTPTSGTAIIGCDAAHGSYEQFYFDSRNVARVYTMTLHGDRWTLAREEPPFARRFTGTFSADGRTITGRWEMREDGNDWPIDFDVTYTRVG